MRTYKRLKRTKLIEEIRTVVETHEQMKKAYFFRPPSSARQRRAYEEDRCASIRFVFDDKTYRITQTTTCSCKNVYYNLEVWVDGYKKNVRTLKSLLEKHG